MTLDELLTTISTTSLRLRAEQDELVIEGNRQSLTPALVKALKTHKDALLTLMSRDGDSWYAQPATFTPDLLPLAELSQEEIDLLISRLPGGASNLKDIYRLGPLQEGILFHYLMGSEGDTYLLATLFRIDSRVRLDQFLEALQSVIDRHDILRTAIYWEDLPHPVQVVHRRVKLPVEEIHLDAADGEPGDQLYARFDPRRYRIDISQAPLIRVAIAYDSQNQTWLAILLLHHLAGDHVTLETIQRELQFFLVGEGGLLPSPRPFRNLIAQATNGISQQQHEAFFRELLGDITEPTAAYGILNFLDGGTHVQEAHEALSRGLSERIKACARLSGVSAASICHVAWARVLSLLSGREDVVFGTVLFGRMLGRSQGALGLFINTLPIRIRLDEGSTKDTIQSAHRLLADLMLHEHAPLALAQRCSSVVAPAPLFTALLNYRHSSGASNATAQATQAWQGIELLRGEERNNYPFTLIVDDTVSHFGITARTPADVDASAVCGYVRTALESIAHCLETFSSDRAWSLNVLPEAELKQLLYQWNDTGVDSPAEGLVHQLFEEQVKNAPNAPAVKWGDLSLSYAELNSRANRLAHHLMHIGVQLDDKVAVCTERSFDLIVAILAVLKAGCAYVPLDPAYPQDRLQFMLTDSRPIAVLTQRNLGTTFGTTSSSIPIVELDRDEADWQSQPDTNLYISVGSPTSENLAYVIYTSGSTGAPKGVMITHGNLSNYLLWARSSYYQESGDGSPIVHSIGFDGIVTTLFGPLISGQPIELLPRGAEIESIVARGASGEEPYRLLKLTPSHLKILNQSIASADQAPTHALMVGGEALVPTDMLFWQRRFPQVTLINHFGPTEATVGCCTFEIGTPIDEVRSIPIGRPIANTRIYVLDSHRRPVPVGVQGELYISGACVARGYLNRPDLTEERFPSDPFSQESNTRMYKTGDLGRWRKDGNIEFLGRNDFQVKIRGFRIELGEIEARLLDYPAVKGAVVIARKDASADERLVAYFTASPDSRIDLSDLRNYLAGIFPDYMVPASYVRLETLPLTANGKIDRNALPTPDLSAQVSREYEPPVGEVETIISEIWRDVLQLDRVGRFDDFFLLGGHSLLAMRVITRLRQRRNVNLPIRDLFAHPVLADLAIALRVSEEPSAPEILPAGPMESFPLSLAQQRLWFLSQMSGVSEAYHIQAGLALEGPLDRNALLATLDRILYRHQALRATFSFDGKEPIQRFSDAGAEPFPLVEHDLSDFSPSDVTLELERLRVLETRLPFDLELGPVIRGRLIRVAERSHVLLITCHHLVSDGWSLGILSDEFTLLYRAFHDGMTDPLPTLGVQYGDYAVWQRRWISTGALENQAEFWKNTLAGASELLTLPLDRPRPNQRNHVGGGIKITFDAELTSALKRLGQRNGCTLYMTLLAGWAILIARLSGQSDVVVGTPVANRNRAEIEKLIGFFVNTLALRLDIPGDLTVTEILCQVRERTVVAQQHQDIPFEQVVEVMNPVRSLAHTPLFQVMFAWQNNERPGIELPDLEVAPLPSLSSERNSKFDLTLTLHELDGRIVGGLEYACALFDESTIERFHSYFRNILASMVNDDSTTISRVSMLPAAERRLLVREWNKTEAVLPPVLFVHHLFEEQVELHPQANAICSDGQHLTYDELNRQSNQLAHHLRSIGVGPGSLVAICAERNFSLIISLLAIVKAGGAYIPLDPAYPAERLQFVIEDALPVTIITEAALVDIFEDTGIPIIDLRNRANWAGELESNLSFSEVGLVNNDLVYVIYTSGSTGKPKGVMVSHRNLANYLLWAKRAYYQGYGGGSPAVHSVGFDGLVTTLFGPLISGQELTLLPERHEIDGLIDLASSQITPFALVKLTPSHLRLLNRSLPLERGAGLTMALMVGGEALVPQDIVYWQEHFPLVRLINHFGPTEVTVGCCTFEIDSPQDESRSIPIGRPIANTYIYILDEALEPVPIGVPGEIYVGGAGVALGYLNRPELTAQRFVRDPFLETDPQSRMYRTGDLGRWLKNGVIEFLGRNDFQLKIRGFRIEAGEIEARLMENPLVREAVVIAREDIPGDKRLVAYYTSHESDRGTSEERSEAAELRLHLMSVLPDHMVPSAYVHLMHFPLTQNGKLDRRALPKPDTRAIAAGLYEAPQGATETTLATLWAELLKQECVGRHDNFFALGGHSLLIVTLIERMRQIGIHIDVRSFFSTPTIASLSAAVTERRAIEVPPNLIPFNADAITPAMLTLIELEQPEIDAITASVPGGPANVQDIYPLTALQEGILFHHRLDNKRDPYLLAHELRFRNRDTLNAFLMALQNLVDRHDIFRSAFFWENLKEPAQAVYRSAQLQVEQVELLPSTVDAARELYDRFNPHHYRIDVRTAPLIQVKVAEDPHNGTWLAVLLRHHLTGDHATLEVIRHEIEAQLSNNAAFLTAPCPYRDAVASSRIGIDQKEQERFFSDLLGDVEEPTAPFGLIDVYNNQLEMEEARLSFDISIAQRIRSHAKRLEVTPASIFHLAWARVLSSLTGKDDVVFGTVLLGRINRFGDSGRNVGLFINTLPFRIKANDANLEVALRLSHAQLGDLIDHEQASLALAQRCSAVPAPAPLFTTLLNYRHGPDTPSSPNEKPGTVWNDIEILRGEEHTNYPITLSINDLREGFSIDCVAPRAFGSERICEYLDTTMRCLIDGLEQASEVRLCDLEVLPISDRRLLLNDWNDTCVPYPDDKCIHTIFEEQAAKSPDAIAVMCDGFNLSYVELDSRANHLADRIFQEQFAGSRYIAIYTERSAQFMVAVLAILKLGCAYLPIDPSTPVDRVRFILEDSQCAVVLAAGPHFDRLHGVLGTVGVIDLGLSQLEPISASNAATTTSQLTSGDAAYVIYTSGSTGQPKGVVVPHRAITRLVCNNGYADFGLGDRVAFASNPAFDAATLEIWAPLLNGGSIVVIDQDVLLDPHRFAAALDRHQVNVLWLTVGLFNAYASLLCQQFSRLRYLIVGGDALNSAVVASVLRNGAPQHLLNGYGPTETTTFAATYEIRVVKDDTVSIPIGRPIGNTTVYILDNHQQLVAPGASAEIYIGGDGVALGYLNQPALTDERFLPDPFATSPDARMYRTGDLGRWLPDGNIEFLGRKDFQVKIRGFRVELGEIEARLVEHPDVLQSVVVARNDVPAGRQLVAYFVSQNSLPIEPDQLRKYLEEQLAPYMIPAAFVHLARLPLTKNGKVDRDNLPSPDPLAFSAAPFEPPVGAREEELAAIWCDMLHIQKVSRHDDFFSLGGHSLLAVSLIERMRNRGMVIFVKTLFTGPTIAQLAKALLVGGIENTLVPPNLIPSDCNRIEVGMLPLLSLAQSEIDLIVSSIPGGARNIQDAYPLAPLQEGILLHHLMVEEGDPYLLGNLSAVDSKEHLDRFLVALQAVIDRHDILRTAVFWEGLAQPVQVVFRVAPLVVEEISLEPGSASADAQLYSRFDPRHHRLDLGRAPMIRAYVAYDSEHQRWLLLLLWHHLIGDHRAIEEIRAEIGAYLRGQGHLLPDPVPFRNVIARSLANRETQDHEGFFKTLLSDVDETTAPFDLLDVRGDGLHVKDAKVVLDPRLSQQIRNCARRQGVTPATICHVAWAMVIAKLTGKDDVVFGTVLFGRMQGDEGANHGIGLFINTLPIRIRLGELPAHEATLHTHQILSELMQHEHASLALAQRCSSVPAPTPLFTSLFNYRHSPQQEGDPSDQRSGTWDGFNVLRGGERTNYPVAISVNDFGEHFSLDTQAADPVDPSRLANYMLTSLSSLTEALEQRGSASLAHLEILPQVERYLEIEGWNRSESPYPHDDCVHSLFEEQVLISPEAPALVYKSNSISYSELNRRANRLARHLHLLGVGPDIRVAICADRGVEMIIAVLAVLKAGGAYVPLDPSYPADRLRFMLEDSGAVALLTQAHLHELVQELPSAIPNLELDSPSPAWVSEDDHNLDLDNVTSDNLAYVIYTSGSTGRPKGVMVEHGGLCNLVVAQIEGFLVTPTSRILQVSSFSFDACVSEIMLALCKGGSLHLIDREQLLDTDALLRFIDSEGITHATITPTLLAALDEQAIPASLKVVIAAGDRLSESVATRWSQRVTLINGYGPTEGTIGATMHVCLPNEPDNPPIGRPFANVKVHILDKHKQPVPRGIAGEIFIAGPGVARGYLNLPELTAERFVENPFSTDGSTRLYRTGDLGRRLPNGEIEFLGRNDMQVKIRGYRVELQEIEGRLMDYAGLRDAAVILREEPGGAPRLVAYYTTEDRSQINVPTPFELSKHLAARLPDHMIPSAFVRLASLPLSPNGKLDRNALPSPASGDHVTRAYESPQGPVENALALIWAEALKLDHVGRHDNFFALGGHSLMAVSLIERMRKEGLNISVKALFDTPTIAQLAGTIETGSVVVSVPPNLIEAGTEMITPEMVPLIALTQEEIDAIVSVVPGGVTNIQDIYPLAPLQEGILFHHLMGGEGDPYLLASLSAVDTKERLSSFLESLQRVIDRHDILRTSLVWEGLSETVQVVWRKAVLPVEELHLDPINGEIDAQLFDRFDPRHHRIELRTAPMLRAYTAFDAPRDRWLLLILWHHIVGDHTTLDVIKSEINSLLRGRADQLPDSVPFRNAVAQARLGISEQEHEAFFKQMLGDVSEPTAPFGLFNVRGDGADIEDARLVIDSGLANRIRINSRRLGISAASLFHLAWALVLARTTGRDDVVFGTVLFGRMQAGMGSDRGIGLFINTLPLRIRLDSQSVEGAAKATHSSLADVMKHEHASLALAQRCSSVPAPSPLFTAVLNYRHHSGGANKSEPWQGIKGLRGGERTNYPFSLSVNDLQEGFSLDAQVPEAIGPLRVCQFMVSALEQLVNALEIAPNTAIHSRDILPSPEKTLLIEDWNNTLEKFPDDTCVHTLFEEQARKTPNHVALVYEGQSLTYAELDRQANVLADYLRTVGVRPNSRVAISVERSFEMVTSILGILKAGGAYVPLDPAYPIERLNFMLDDSEPVALLTQQHLQSRFVGVNAVMPVVNLSAHPATWPEFEAVLDGPARDAQSEDLAYVIYTSGSTGRPKGVMVEHRGLCNLVAAQIKGFSIKQSSRVLQFASVSFDACVSELFTALCQGASLHIAPQSTMLAGRALTDFIKREAISHVTLPPAVLAALPEGSDLAPVETLILAGEAVSGALVKRWGPHHRIINGYGPTENTVCATMHHCTVADEDQNPPIGKPIANVRLYILDQHLRPAPIGVSGEIFIAGAGVARGYLNRSDLTNERFLIDPFAGNDRHRMYRTGDLGRWRSDGTVDYIGRTDFQIKMRGFRVELGEVEAALLELPEIREVVVTTYEFASDDKRLVAYYVAAPDVEWNNPSAVLRSYIAGILPEYMVPSAYIPLLSVPLTPNGKLDRKQLPVPDADLHMRRDFEPPQGEIETLLAEVWVKILKQERIGRYDNFFSLGGYSLLTVRVVALLEQAGIAISVLDLYSHPTLKTLADFISASSQPSTQNAKQAAVLIREGTEGPSLFLTHCGEGELLYAPALAAELDVSASIYGLPSPPLGQENATTIEAMATRMVRMILEVQLRGPYRLAGWSTGGALAYEIANQLIGSDHEVSFVGMFDTSYPQGFDEAPKETPLDLDDKDLLLRNIQSSMNRDADQQLVVEGLKSSVASLSFAEVVERVKDLGLLPEGFSHFSAEQARQWLARTRTIGNANKYYVASPISAPVYLFTAEASRRANPSLGWSSVASEHLFHIVPAPGTHQTMMQSPHVSVLGNIVSATIESSRTVYIRHPEFDYSPVFTLQTPRRPGGAHLFCIPGAGGNVTGFMELAAQLDKRWHVHGLQPRGLDGILVPHATVSSAASCYLRALDDLKLEGSIHLLGHSFGGWVAFEMAVRLVEKGRVLGSLTIVDSEAPGTRSSSIPDRTYADALCEMIRVFEQVIGHGLLIDIKRLETLHHLEQLKSLHEALIQEKLMPKGSEISALKGPLRTFSTALRTPFETDVHFPGQILLVMADDPHLRQADNQRKHQEVHARWQLAARDVAVAGVQGNHMTLLKTPHVQSLADLLNHLLSVPSESFGALRALIARGSE
jgi:amino acid adenylation domain-containing protein